MQTEYVAVEDRLRRALQGGQLSTTQANRAEALLSRLVSPVRVAVLGQRRSGKTSVFNLLAGAKVLPVGAALPTAQLMWGLPPKTTCTYPDKSTRQFGAATAEELSEGQPIFISMQRDLPVLRKIALLEVVMDGSPATQSKALAWAAARCDLAVWCTSDFGPDDRELLSAVSPALRKHTIVSRTFADELRGPDALAHRLETLKESAADTSGVVCPLDGNRALVGLTSGGPSATDLLRASGAEALTQAVLEKVDAGYGRVRDAAESLLEEVVLNAARAVAAAPQPLATPSTPEPLAAPPEPEPARTLQTPPTIHEEPVDRPKHAPVESIAPPSAPTHLPTPAPTMRPAYASDAEDDAQASDGAGPGQRPAPEDGQPASAGQSRSTGLEEVAQASVASEGASPVSEFAPRRKPLTPEGRKTVDGAIRYLSERGRSWVAKAQTSPKAVSDQIMADILGDAEWLANYLGDPFEDDEELIAPAREMANDIVDLAQLMEMERTESATKDAVCLLLQAQRCLQSAARAA